MIPTLTAVSYQCYLGTGRTKPCVFICEDDQGKRVGEYVVKLRSNIEKGTAGLLREVVASLLAKHIGLVVPDPAIVKIEDALVGAIIDQYVAESVRKSIGLNFGSKFISGGFVTWPCGKSVPISIKQNAVDTFVFDMLIQNPDRRISKPNLLWKDDQLYLIDHEMGFSFLLDIFLPQESWRIANLNFINEHVFFNDLRHSNNLDFSRYERALRSVTNEIWNDFVEQIPQEWINGNLEKIKNHIYQVRDNLTTFLDEVRRVLI